MLGSTANYFKYLCYDKIPNKYIMDVRVRAARIALHLKDTDLDFEDAEGKTTKT